MRLEEKDRRFMALLGSSTYLSWHVHESANALTSHPEQSRNALPPLCLALQKGKRYNLSPHLHACLHSAPFSKSIGVSETGHEKGNVQEPEEETQSEHQVLPPNSKLVVWTLDADQFIKWIAMYTYLLFMSAACWTGNLCGWDVLLYSWLHYPEEMQAISDPVLCIWGPHWVFE